MVSSDSGLFVPSAQWRTDSRLRAEQRGSVEQPEQRAALGREHSERKGALGAWAGPPGSAAQRHRRSPEGSEEPVGGAPGGWHDPREAGQVGDEPRGPASASFPRSWLRVGPGPPSSPGAVGISPGQRPHPPPRPRDDTGLKRVTAATPHSPPVQGPSCLPGGGQALGQPPKGPATSFQAPGSCSLPLEGQGSDSASYSPGVSAGLSPSQAVVLLPGPLLGTLPPRPPLGPATPAPSPWASHREVCCLGVSV